MKKTRYRGYVRSLFFKITVIYASVLLLMGIWGCYVSYSKERSAIVHRMDRTLDQLSGEYRHVTEDFWRLYMPIFENPNSIYASLRNLYRLEPGREPSPMERSELAKALQAVLANDERIAWVAIYNHRDMSGWMLCAGDNAIRKLPGDFPWLEDLSEKGASMEIFESRLFGEGKNQKRYFVQCGGVAPDIRDGSLLVGYNTQELTPEDVQDPQLARVRFLLFNDNGTIYDSAGTYDLNGEYLAALAGLAPGTFRDGNTLCFLQNLNTGTESYKVLCVAPWWDIFRESLSYTPMIALVVFLFWSISLLIYNWTGKAIRKKTRKIQYGLEQIGSNHLDYRIGISGEAADEFDDISRSVNHVAAQLQENIQKAYLSKLRQREAELSELQAKFDPHFLYNTLEVIRGRVYENGDDETADIIVKLAQIFRSFIGSEIFVTVREELDFCNLYLSLLRYRYDNRVTIVYDVDSDILDCGIVRNLLQPILENYFIHGFSPDKQDNRLVINGRREDDIHIRFCIEDNGAGITPERLAQIREKLEADKPSGKGSYGLNNIHRRITLFYGPDCGLELYPNDQGGATIQVRILSLSCGEHEQRLSGEVD